MTTDRIIYQLSGQPMSVVIPCACGLSTRQIGVKDVPEGVPFWIVDVSDMPADRTFRDAWELDIEALGKPAGFGSAK